MTQMGKIKLPNPYKSAMIKVQNDVHESQPHNQNGTSMRVELLLLCAYVLREGAPTTLQITSKQMSNAFMRRLFIMQRWYVAKKKI